MTPADCMLKGLKDGLSKEATFGKVMRKAVPYLAAAGVAGTGIGTAAAIKEHKGKQEEEAKKNAVIRYMVLQRLRESGY